MGQYEYFKQISSEKNSLTHHGILGQKWGHRRYQNPDGSLTKLGESRYKKLGRIDSKNDYLEKKYYKKLARATRYEKRAEKIHAERDLGASNRKAVKSARYQIKADKLKRKAVTVDDEYNKAKLLVKAEENQYKSDKYHRDADLLSKLTGYSFAAMRKSQKAANLEANAQKIKLKIQRNKRFQELIKKEFRVEEENRLKGNKIERLKEEFEDSDERYEASAKAYDATYKYFQKNEPELLKSMIKDNGGNKDTLEQYHDFRKTFEGFDDEFQTKAEADYIKKHEND